MTEKDKKKSIKDLEKKIKEPTQSASSAVCRCGRQWHWYRSVVLVYLTPTGRQEEADADRRGGLGARGAFACK